GIGVPAGPGVGQGDIVVGPDGRLYLATASGVDRYDAQTGALIDHFIPNGVGGLNGASEIAFGGGALYVKSPAMASVLRYDATSGAFRDVFITPDQYGLAGTAGPRQIAFAVPEPGAGLLSVAG